MDKNKLMDLMLLLEPFMKRLPYIVLACLILGFIGMTLWGWYNDTLIITYE